MSGMTDPTPPTPVPGIVDLRSRLTAGETLFGTFTDLGSPVAAELWRGPASTGWSSTSSTARRPKAELLGQLHAVGDDPDRGARPHRSRPSGCGSAAPSTSARTGSWSRGSTSPSRPARPSRYMRYPPDGMRGAGARDARRGARRARPRRRPAHQRADPRHHPGRVAGRRRARAGDRRHRRRRRPVRRPGRPVAQPGGPRSVRRPGLPRRARAGRRGRGRRTARQPGSCFCDAAALPRHRDSASGSSASASDGAFIADGARAVAGRRPSLTGPPVTGAVSDPRRSSRRRAAWPARGARRGRGPVCATTTPTMINAAPTSWIGLEALAKDDPARTTMVSGSMVLINAAWAAPIRRAPA